MRTMSDADRLNLRAHIRDETRRSPRPQGKRPLYPMVESDAFSAIRLQAAARHIGTDELARMILEAVAEQDLFAIVLDGMNSNQGDRHGRKR